MGSRDKWEFYLDKSGNWRWRRVATNGRIVGASSEGYQSRDDCETTPGVTATRVKEHAEGKEAESDG